MVIETNHDIFPSASAKFAFAGRATKSAHCQTLIAAPSGYSLSRAMAHGAKAGTFARTTRAMVDMC